MTTMASKLKDRTIRRLNKEKKVIKSQVGDREVINVPLASLIVAIRDFLALGYSDLEIVALTEYSVKQIQRLMRRKERKNVSSNR